ncbi:MAG: aminotransferase class III-fold pyridoxal phosphate-dependent enzyme [Anaerolineae bacterium]|nr:MAG: aminotransferase class III-fold pyridoxal phosphate-dependent enzyme [Anaerolineae bacterium]
MSGHVFYRRLGHEYPIVARGQGVYLYDTKGKSYLDASGGALVVNIGHGVPEITEAMATQARQVSFAHGTQFTSQPLETYAAALGDVSPIPDPWLYLVSGGSEAIETALKLARQVCVARGGAGRYKIIARWSSYHGATLGALSASGRTPLRRPYAPLLADFAHIPPAYCYRCPFGRAYPSCDLACADALEAEVQRQGPETVAAFIAEPVVGATLAAAVPPREYWPRVREICDRHGVLLIADEVMTGMGRTGKWFAIEHWNVMPDVLVTAKGASGGYFPLGLVLAREELVEAIRSGPGNFTHGFTYANGVMGAAVGLAVLRHLKAHDLVAASARMGEYLLQRLGSLRDLPSVGDVRGLGLMAGVELVADKASKRPFPRAQRVAEQVQAEAMARGVIVYYGTGLADGIDGDAVLLGPPFIVTPAQIDEMAGVLRASIAAVTGR